MTIKDTLAKAGRALEHPEKWAIRLSLLAAVVAILVKSGLIDKEHGRSAQIVFALSIGMAALVFEYISAKKMTHGWIDRSLAGLVGWGLIWAGAFAYSCNNWLGVAAEGESAKATAQKAAYVAFTDTRSDLDAARKRVQEDEATVKQIKAMTWQEMPKVKGKAVMSVDAARTLMDNAKEGSTQYTQAKTALEDLTERAKWADKLEKAEARLEEGRKQLTAARSTASSATATTSDQRADLRVYIKYLKMDAETAEDVQSWLKIGVISLFVSLSAILGVLEARSNEPRRPWIRWRSALANVRNAWDGKGVEKVEITKHITHDPLAAYRQERGLAT